MAYENILTDQKDRVAIITLNRPERKNALNDPALAELRQAIRECNEDPTVGAMVLTGAGDGFCAGWDISNWKQGLDGEEEKPSERSRSEDENWVHLVQRSKPIVAAINGASIGMGLTIALPCDVRIASEKARLSVRFVRVGIVPELASSRLLSSIVGLTHAMELMLTGRIIDAQEAGRIGLVNRVVPHDELMDKAVEVAAEIARNASETLLNIKRLVWENLMATDLDQVMASEGEALRKAMEGPAFKEAVNAFTEKRAPQFEKVG